MTFGDNCLYVSTISKSRVYILLNKSNGYTIRAVEEGAKGGSLGVSLIFVRRLRSFIFFWVIPNLLYPFSARIKSLIELIYYLTFAFMCYLNSPLDY